MRRYSDVHGLTQTEVLNLAVEHLRAKVDEEITIVTAAIERANG